MEMKSQQPLFVRHLNFAPEKIFPAKLANYSRPFEIIKSCSLVDKTWKLDFMNSGKNPQHRVNINIIIIFS